MRDGHCPKCGATAIYRRGDIGKGSNSNAILVNLAPLTRHAWVDIYVCVNCGYVENYIEDAKHLSFIADHWTAVLQADTARVADGGTDKPTQRLPNTPPM